VLCREEGTQDAYIMEDRIIDKYVELAESVGMTLMAMTSDEISNTEGKMIRVKVTGVLNPETPLPVIVRDVNGAVICRTLREAYEKGMSVWWPEGDLEVTYDDGCMSKSFSKQILK
jgi:hypothetical protein